MEHNFKVRFSTQINAKKTILNNNFKNRAKFVGPGCPQICQLPPFTCTLGTSEDCLHLDIYTPRVNETNPDETFPVMFFIHGGNFIQVFIFFFSFSFLNSYYFYHHYKVLLSKFNFLIIILILFLFNIIY